MKRFKAKFIHIMLVILALVCSCFMNPGTVTTVYASSAESAGGAIEITLNSRNTEENVAFRVQNMLPGDRQIGIYNVEVTYKDSVTVHFGTDIPAGYEKLAEVLKVKVKLLEPEDVQLYDGLMKDMPDNLDRTLETGDGKATENLTYEITAYLDKSVGNEYQGQQLAADFIWWAEGARPEQTTESGTPGGESDNESDTGADGNESGSNGADNDTSGSGAVAGDSAPLLATVILLVCSGLMFLILFGSRKKAMKADGTTESVKVSEKAIKLCIGIATVIALVIGLAVTTWALTIHRQEVKNNLFETGEISINLNDGVPIIKEEGILFEPGMTVKKDFFIENDGTCEVYYKIYADNVDDNKLADTLEVTLMFGTEVLYTGTLPEMTKAAVDSCKDILNAGERHMLSIYFRFPTEGKNDLQDIIVDFDIFADAVQARNNSEREF